MSNPLHSLIEVLAKGIAEELNCIKQKEQRLKHYWFLHRKELEEQFERGALTMAEYTQASEALWRQEIDG